MHDPGPTKPGRLDVGVVGAGRVGAVMGAALRAAGHNVTGASGVSEQSVTRIEALLPGVAHLDPEHVVRSCDLVVIAVPDDALVSLVAGLAKVGAWRPAQIAFHTSGLHGLGALAQATEAGVIGLAIHPAMTFTGTSLDLTRVRDAAFAVTAPAPVLPIGQALVVEIGGSPFVLDDAARPRYHAALVHAANHAVTAFSQAAILLAEAGVDNPGRVLGPVVHASIEGAAAEEPGAVTTLTGPVVRGDAGTVAAHVEALAPHPTTLAAYIAMARATAHLARDAGRLPEAQYREVMEALGGDS